ncbi:MAG: site-2 protease family protein [Chloroflexota bacterium]|nr:site-2 protease family protein [Chloroflexota bacterium]
MSPLEALLNSEAGLLVTLPLALAVLSVIVFVHELGHFVAARRFGVHVKEFAIGFPPRLKSVLRGGNAYPAVRLTQDPIDVSGRLVRLWSGDPASNLARAIVVLDGDGPYLRADAAHAAASSAAGVIVAEPLAIDDVADLAAMPIPVIAVSRADAGAMRTDAAGREAAINTRRNRDGKVETYVRIGATRFALNVVPLGGYVRMTGENDEFDAPGSFMTRPAWQRGVILLAGPLMNVLLTPLFFLVAAMIADVTGSLVAGVVPNSPAAAAGLQEGDQLLRIDDRDIVSPADVRDAVRAAAGRDATIVVKRQDSELAVVATPRLNPPPGEGALGILLRATVGPAPIHVAVPRAFQRTWDALLLLPRVIGEAIAGTQPLEMAGPVGIVQTVGVAARQGPEIVFILAAFLTAQIGLLNLAPWPGLDGGRLIFVLVELLTGRRVPPRREAAFHFVGIMVLLTLVLVITVGDVQRIAGA